MKRNINKMPGKHMPIIKLCFSWNCINSINCINSYVKILKICQINKKHKPKIHASEKNTCFSNNIY